MNAIDLLRIDHQRLFKLTQQRAGRGVRSFRLLDGSLVRRYWRAQSLARDALDRSSLRGDCRTLRCCQHRVDRLAVRLLSCVVYVVPDIRRRLIYDRRTRI